MTPFEALTSLAWISAHFEQGKTNNCAVSWGTPAGGATITYVSKRDWEDWKAKSVSVIQKASRGDKPVEAPNCPKDGTRMRYDAQAERFVCGEPQCNMTARPKVTAESLKDTVLSGDIELVRTSGEETKWFLHLVHSRVMVDITNVIETDATGERHGGNGAWLAGLTFANGVREIEE